VIGCRRSRGGGIIRTTHVLCVHTHTSPTAYGSRSSGVPHVTPLKASLQATVMLNVEVSGVVCGPAFSLQPNRARPLSVPPLTGC